MSCSLLSLNSNLIISDQLSPKAPVSALLIDKQANSINIQLFCMYIICRVILLKFITKLSNSSHRMPSIILLFELKFNNKLISDPKYAVFL